MIKVIDVFAGPGGLNEGFSGVRDDDGSKTFEISASFEMETRAVETLRLRAAARAVGLSDDRTYLEFLNGHLTYEQLTRQPAFADALRQASEHVHQIELGESTRSLSDRTIEDAGIERGGEWVLIGGPPCQAYSLAGRSRRVHDPLFEDDHKHFLFREYLHIIDKYRPVVFVMENVKGLLSASHGGQSMFSRVLKDLSCGGEYEIRSFVAEGEGEALRPADFVIASERYGVPQRRHRVILLGVRRDAALGAHTLLSQKPLVTMGEALKGLPPVRSRVSPLRADSPGSWLDARRRGWGHAAKYAGVDIPDDRSLPRDASPHMPYVPRSKDERPTDLQEWLESGDVAGVWHHEPRSHMSSDLVRYAFLAAVAETGDRPNLDRLPAALLPNHKNATRKDAPFIDRFKVQLEGEPSSTVVSHIAKDGHHYIHPDPVQMRSLTVREAARLQSFPDDYFFVGNRTAQFHQVGNAVPPRLARQLGDIVRDLLKG